MTGRLQSFATLGLMSVLAAGFGLWSAFSGPQVADVQLHDAAADTLAASGFVETLQLTATASTIKSSEPNGSSSPTTSKQPSVSTTTVDYQAPDRFTVVGSYQENGSKGETELRLTQIGSACWEEPDADNPSAPSEQSKCDPSNGSDLLNVLRDLENSSTGTLRGGVYTLDQRDSPQFVSYLYGPFSKLFKGQAVKVGIDGSYVSWVHFVLTAGSGKSAGDPYESISISFKDVGSAPPVIRPASGPAPTATTIPATPTTSTPTTLAG